MGCSPAGSKWWTLIGRSVSRVPRMLRVAAIQLQLDRHFKVFALLIAMEAQEVKGVWVEA